MQVQSFLQRKPFKQSVAHIQSRMAGRALRSRFMVLFFLAFFGVSPFPALSVVHAQTKAVLHADLPPADPAAAFPASLGEIIYRFNPESRKQLYIVGISHRAPFVGGTDAVTTVQTQSELYRIGEWLRRNRGLDLLLPEGFFHPDRALSGNNFVINVDLPIEGLLSLDDDVLAAKLSDRTRFVNAEMLLMKNFRMQVGQVEDRGLYNEVYDSLFRLKAGESDSQEYIQALFELDRLQKNRTAFILQKAPVVIDTTFTQGKIQKRQALLTIGLNHLQEIIRYINKNEINMDFFRAGQDKAELSRLPAQTKLMPLRYKYASQLNLIKEGFGISIIVPRVLASDSMVMEMTGLAEMIMEGRGGHS
jgi:hypothetical protein